MESSSSTPVTTVGELGRYRLIAELARGGMGIVYLALVRGPAGFNKLFVVKELKGHLLEDAQLVTMFLEEARLSAKLNHPNVVQTIEVGSEGQRHFIAMEYLDGQAFHRILSRSDRDGAPLPLEYHLQILSGMLEGMHYAHDLVDYDGTPLGIVHRDISPHNLFVGYDGQVKLLDFGIAKALDSTNDTSTGILKGKIRYMAPEQVSHEGNRTLDRRVDVFAAGVMLWESVVGMRLWGPTMTDVHILHALSTGGIPDVRQAKPHVDADLAFIVDRATAADPSERYASAADLQTALDRYRARMPGTRIGPRDVGRVVSDLFSRDRAKMKAVIDDQLRVLRGVATGQYGAVSLPRLSPPSATGTPPTGSASLATLGSSGANAVSVSVSVTPASRPVRRNVLPALAAGIGIVGAAGVFVALRLANSQSAPSDAPAAVSVAAAPIASAPVAVAPGGPALVSEPPPSKAAPTRESVPTASAPPAQVIAAPNVPSHADPAERRATADGHRGRAPKHVADAPAPSAAPPTAPPAASARNRQQIDPNDPYAQ